MPVIIREASPKDAAKLVNHVNALLEEPVSYLEMARGEFTFTIEDEKKFIADCKKSENTVFIVAEERGEIIGSLMCAGRERVKIRHNTVLGMSVKKEYRNQGIGSRLMEYAINWAKGTGVVKRIELHVFETNNQAIHLYKKYGFIIEGKKQKSIKVNDEYINELIMALPV